MDTLSRDSNSSGSILPLVGVIAAGLALVLSATALFKLSALQKSVVAQGEEMGKITTLESDVRTATAKSENDVKSLRTGVQAAFDQLSPTLDALQTRMTKLEEAAKKPVPVAASKPGSPAAAPTGVLNSDGTYSIAPGDNLSKIAKKFGVSLDALESANPGIDSRHLNIGQKVKIPGK